MGEETGRPGLSWSCRMGSTAGVLREQQEEGKVHASPRSLLLERQQNPVENPHALCQVGVRIARSDPAFT